MCYISWLWSGYITPTPGGTVSVFKNSYISLCPKKLKTQTTDWTIWSRFAKVWLCGLSMFVLAFMFKSLLQRLWPMFVWKCVHFPRKSPWVISQSLFQSVFILYWAERWRDSTDRVEGYTHSLQAVVYSSTRSLSQIESPWGTTSMHCIPLSIEDFYFLSRTLHFIFICQFRVFFFSSHVKPVVPNFSSRAHLSLDNTILYHFPLTCLFVFGKFLVFFLFIFYLTSCTFFWLFFLYRYISSCCKKQISPVVR